MFIAPAFYLQWQNQYQDKNTFSLSILCVLFIFKIFCLLWCLPSLKTFPAGERQPPGTSQFVETAKDSTGTAFICKLTNPELHLFCLACTSPEAMFLCLNQPRARCQTTRNHPYILVPTEIIQLANPTLPTLRCLASPAEPSKGSCLDFPSLLSSATWPKSGASPRPFKAFSDPLSRTCEYTKLCFLEPSLMATADWPSHKIQNVWQTPRTDPFCRHFSSFLVLGVLLNGRLWIQVPPQKGNKLGLHRHT